MTPEDLKKQVDKFLKEKLKDPDFRQRLAQSMDESYIQNRRRYSNYPMIEPDPKDSG